MILAALAVDAGRRVPRAGLEALAKRLGRTVASVSQRRRRMLRKRAAA